MRNLTPAEAIALSQRLLDDTGACAVVEAPLAFLYEDIGLPIPVPELPWLEDIDVVRRRWLEGWRHTLVRPPGWEYSEDLYG